MPDHIEPAANAIRTAQFLLYTSGAGMGVDSGLPDFRGNEGFWKAYPPIAKLGLSFSQIADPRWFFRDPGLAWGFYGHRLNLYRQTTPHTGFEILKKWASQKPMQIYTSNVDGQWQKAGFSEVCEVHGSILHLQCTAPYTDDLWSAADLELEIGDDLRVVGELPKCPNCGLLARPNILMFSDSAWVLGHSLAQEKSLMKWLESLDASHLTIIEMGAGIAIPSVRYFGEHWQKQGATLIRINPRESNGPVGTLSIPLGARAGLEGLDALLSNTFV